MEDLSFPIGKYVPQPFSEEQLKERLIAIQYLPQHLENSILNLDEHQIETPYRPGGWTVKQLVHHVADSHMNAFIRCKLGLTEDNPPIKPYKQDAWANLNDSKIVPTNISITLLHALHARWVALLNGISSEALERTVFHPELNKEITLWHLLGLYAWHSKHHVAHITALRERMKW
jgi:DinB superfamily